MRFLALGFALGCGLALPAQATEATQWLERLARAEQQESYSGTFVYGLAAGFSSHALWHRAEDGHVRERFLRLDGSPAEVIRVDGAIQCSSDEFVAQVANGNGWQSPRLDPELLQLGYRLRSVGDSRVAGRPTRVLAILPRDQHRYGVELHLDSDTALPLKVLLLDESGQLIERYQYTTFQVGEVDPELLRPVTDCRPVLLPKASMAAGIPWHSDWLPPGFHLLDSGVRPSPASPRTVNWLAFGDGLAKFSVFIESLAGAPVPDERAQLGPTSAVSKRITTAEGDFMVTVVGEIPLGTAERIALSMRRD